MSDQYQHPLDVDPILNAQQAASFLNTTTATLKQSRYTGMLYGKPAPCFIKMGRIIRYRLSTLMAFREQFPECRNTTELNYPLVTKH